MPSVISSFEYDIFISYRHNDNRSGWVTEFVKHLNEELAATIKEPVSVYFDSNPHDGLLETHNVDKSLEGKLKCLIFIPIISQTYCDTKSFAWQHEFCAFNKQAKEDQFGRDIKVLGGNVASRILPIKIHDLDADDKAIIENEIEGTLRDIEFIYRSSGVNRPLTPSDSPEKNLSRTFYRDQINKVANGVKEIILGLKHFENLDAPRAGKLHPSIQSKKPFTKVDRQRIFKIVSVAILVFLIVGYLLFNAVGIIGLSKEEQIPIHKLFYPLWILVIVAFVSRQPVRKMGYTLMQVSALSVFGAGLAGILFTFISSTVPDQHREFLHVTPENISSDLVHLEFALLRSLGTALMAVGLGCWALLLSLAKQRNKTLLVVLVIMITLAEGNEAIQMYILSLPFFIYPISIVLITWIGAVLWWKSDPHVLANLSTDEAG